MFSVPRIFRSPFGGYFSHGSPPGDTEYVDGASPPEDEDDEALSPFRVMKRLFLGFHFGLIYGLGGLLLLVIIDGQEIGKNFFFAYTTSYRTIISLGVVSGTAIIVYHSQHVIPRTVRKAFRDTPLPEKYEQRERMFLKRSLRLPTIFGGFLGDFLLLPIQVTSSCATADACRGLHRIWTCCLCRA
jgi:hypothetical protein